MLIIGLTGGIGSGKSAAAACFADQGIHIVDADLVARQVVEPGTPGLAEIREHFGDAVIRPDGTLDRAALRQRVFAAPEERKWLEALLHPIIRRETVRQLEQGDSPYAVLVSPLLVETDQAELVDRILVIDVPEALQIERTCRRDSNSEEQVKAIMAAQANRQTRLDRADDIIVNDRDLASLQQEVLRLHKHYLTLAQCKKLEGRG